LITSMDLLELSVVSIPSNAAALFQLTAKAYSPRLARTVARTRVPSRLDPDDARLLMKALRDLDVLLPQAELRIMGDKYRADLARRRVRALHTR
jgi:hypothetical protein